MREGLSHWAWCNQRGVKWACKQEGVGAQCEGKDTEYFSSAPSPGMLCVSDGPERKGVWGPANICTKGLIPSASKVRKCVATPTPASATNAAPCQTPGLGQLVAKSQWELATILLCAESHSLLQMRRGWEAAFLWIPGLASVSVTLTYGKDFACIWTSELLPQLPLCGAAGEHIG